MPTDKVHIFGIRHHGPGSARSLVRALDRLQPTAVLIEGPPDADSIIPLAAHVDTRPPVAILVYVEGEPRRCVYYPFAVFSPEWQAIQWALHNKVAVRFMDLPQSIQLAMAEQEHEKPQQEDQPDQSDRTDPSDIAPPPIEEAPALEMPNSSPSRLGRSSREAHLPSPGRTEERAGVGLNIRRDPLRALAEAAGYEDGERWWDHMIEHRADSNDLFLGIMEAITALRAEADRTAPIDSDTGDLAREPLREAFMRQTIRAAQREGHERIAVVCGAWHAPALADRGPAKADKALLDGLPKVKTAASWIPWTYSRLSYHTGYGAGIESPGWYHHLWTYGAADPPTTNTGDDALSNGATSIQQGRGRTERDAETPSPTSTPLSRDGRPADDNGTPTDQQVRSHQDWGLGGRSPASNGDRSGDVVVPWLTRVAHLLREQDLDASPASIIEAVRLAECLAALRGRPIAGLPELNEATQTVLCFGSGVPMRLIAEKLIVGETLGDVPDDAPAVPLQQDLQRQQKRLRLAPEAAQKPIDLDLRKPVDLERSELLHRLSLLGIPWGKPDRGGSSKGTFHELWRLQWHPEFSIALIEKGVWGNTVVDAASAYASDQAENAPDLPTLSRLLDAIMLARLPVALRRLMERLEDVSAHASDVQHLMGALPPLANVLRYGNVRGTDTSMVAHTIDGLVARICIGLPAACASLDDDAAAAMSKHIAATNGAISLLQNEEHRSDWQSTLIRLTDLPNLHGLISGQSARLLLDSGVFTADEAGRHMSLALSAAVDPAQAAAWVEGFLAGSGLLLVHDRTLWQILDNWVSGLGEEHFTNLLPLLRRTFSTFSAPERRQLGERAKAGRTVVAKVDIEDALDHARAAEALPYALALLGLS